jgi:Dolichyl-phosphate-mannose-protein mannosyltransferase
VAVGVEYVPALEHRVSEQPRAALTGATAREVAQLVLTTALVATGIALLTTSVVIPSIFGDELRYWEAARSFANGDGLSIRGGTYGYGPVYPVVLSPILGLASPASAYAIAKVVNALLFTSAAIPVYFLARRLIDHSWSLVVALLSVCGPVAVYAAFVLTESTAYPAACTALLAMVIALERPTLLRQLIVLAAVAFATGSRPQLAVLAGALVAGYCICLVARRGPARRAYVRSLWPTLLAVLLGALAIAQRIVADGASALGGYADLASTDFSVLAGIVWTWWTVGAFVLSLAIVPALLLVPIVRTLAFGARSGSSADLAFLSLLIAVTGVLALSVGFFSSTPESLEIIHERYFFYLVPLWLTGVAVWGSRGAPAPKRHIATGAVLAFLLVVTLPPGLRKMNSTVWFEWPSSAPWVLGDAVVPFSGMSFSIVAAAVGIIIAILGVLASRRRRLAVFIPVTMAFALAGMFGWVERSVISHIDRTSYGASPASAWVDSAVGADAKVLSFFPGSKRCSHLSWRRAMLYTEFDNASIDRAFHLRQPSAPVIASTPAKLDSRGAVVDFAGRPIAADLVLAPKGVSFAGRRIAEGHNGLLVLWAVGRELRVLGASSNAGVFRTACPPTLGR